MKASLFTTLCLVMALAACGQPVEASATSTETTDALEDVTSMNPSVRAALEVVHAAGDGTGTTGGEAEVVEVSADGDGEIVEASVDTQQMAMEELREEMPDHAQHANDDGSFNRDSAARAIFESEGCSAEEAYDRADIMAREWYAAYEAKTYEILQRV